MWATNLKIFLVVIGTLGAYTLVANAIPQIESDVPEELVFREDMGAEELVSAGEELFDGAGGCTACHGLGTRAPNLRTDEAGLGAIGARCGQRVPGEDCKAYLYRSLVEPNAYVVEGYGPIMPDASRTLSQTQIWALVAYLESLGGEVTVTAEDIRAAQAAAPAAPAAAAGPAEPATASTDVLEVMRANLCFGCHLLGDEGVELGPPFDGIASRRSAEEIRTAILDPNAVVAEGYEHLQGAMPANFGETLTAAQLEAIVRFLSTRR